MTVLSALTPAASVSLADQFYGLSGANSRVFTLDQIRADVFWCGTAGGTANALTLTPTITIAAYAAGQVFSFIAASANTSATVTVNVGGLGVKSITGLAIGQIQAGASYQVTYNGTAFSLLALAGQNTALQSLGFLTRAEAEALNNTASITVLGCYQGGVLCLYEKDASGTSLTAADGQNWSPASGMPSMPQHWGAVGDGVTDDTAAITAWLVYMQTGSAGYLPSGTYSITSTIDLTPTGNIHVHAADNAIIKGAASIGANVILKLNAVTREQYEFRWKGGVWDNSLVTFTLAAQSGTCIALKKLYRVFIENVSFLALADYEASQAAAVSDAGITAVDCRFMTVSNCYFRGQSDAGVYTSGDVAIADTTDDGGLHSFVGNHFDRCSVGLTLKRESRNTTITGNTFERCYLGVTFFYAGASIPAGDATTVTANAFYKCETPIDSRGAVGLVISSNTIEDWGFELDGVTEGNKFAIRLLNTRESVVIGNQLHFVDWAPSAAEGIRLDYSNTITRDQTSRDNQITGNIINGSFYGIREFSDAVLAGECNHIWNNYCIGQGGGRQVAIELATSKTNVLYAEPDVPRLRMFQGQDEILRIQDGVLDAFKIDVKQVVYPTNSIATIASGSIAFDGYDMRVDTQASAATDDLDTISGPVIGAQVRIRPNSDTRTIVVKNGTGNITLAADVTLDERWKSIVLQYDGVTSQWTEVSRGGF